MARAGESDHESSHTNQETWTAGRKTRKNSLRTSRGEGRVATMLATASLDQAEARCEMSVNTRIARWR
jgi:hypothetical protein